MQFRKLQAASQELFTAQLSSVSSMIEKQLEWIKDNDYNAERSMILLYDIKSYLEPYKQLRYERRSVKTANTGHLFISQCQRSKNKMMDRNPHHVSCGITVSKGGRM